MNLDKPKLSDLLLLRALFVSCLLIASVKTVFAAKLNFDDGRYQVLVINGLRLVCHDTESPERPNLMRDTDTVCERALPYMEERCDQSILQACTNLGHFYQHSRRIGIDRRLAQEIYQRTCERGDLEACNHMDRALRVKVNWAVAFDAIAERCRDSEDHACIEYARALVSDHFNVRGAREAKQILEAKCNSGKPEACYYLANFTMYPSFSAGIDYQGIMSGSCRPLEYEVCRLALARFLLTKDQQSWRESERRMLDYVRANDLDIYVALESGDFKTANNTWLTANEFKRRLLLESVSSKLSDTDKLEKALDQFVAEQPGQAVPLLLRSAYRLGKLVTSGVYFYKLSNGKPRFANRRSKIGASESAEHYYRSAKADLERVLKLDSDQLYAQVMLAKIAYSEVRDDDLQMLVQEMEQRQPAHLGLTELKLHVSRNDVKRGFVHEPVNDPSIIAARAKNRWVEKYTNLIERKSDLNAKLDVSSHRPLTFEFLDGERMYDEVYSHLINAQWEEGCRVAEEYRYLHPFNQDAHWLHAKCEQHSDEMNLSAAELNDD